MFPAHAFIELHDECRTTVDVWQRAVCLHPSYVRVGLRELPTKLFRPSKELIPPNVAYPVHLETPHPVALSCVSFRMHPPSLDVLQAFVGLTTLLLLAESPPCLGKFINRRPNEESEELTHPLLSGSVCRVRDSLDFLDVSTRCKTLRSVKL